MSYYKNKEEVIEQAADMFLEAKTLNRIVQETVNNPYQGIDSVPGGSPKAISNRIVALRQTLLRLQKCLNKNYRAYGDGESNDRT